MAEVALRRAHPLEGRQAAAPGVSVVPAPAATRLILRASGTAVAPLSKALGITLPRKPKQSASDGGRTALWLGPDEWLVIDENEADPVAACATVKALHSAVDVSHRNTAILVSGPAAAAAINAGCPQDLSTGVFPVGAVSRTVFAKAEIVLWRDGEESFRVECWRSFCDYVFGLLAEAARDAG